VKFLIDEETQSAYKLFIETHGDAQMNNFLALLEGRTLDRATKAIEILDRANAAGSIYNIELKEVKDDLGRALDTAKDKFQGSIDRDRLNANIPAIQEFWYWYAGLAGVPSILKRLKKLQTKDDAPEIKTVLVWLEEVAPYAAIVKSLKDKVIMGRRPSETPVVFDWTNTGTCAICGRIHKITKAKKMVDHGFELAKSRQGNFIGYRIGGCFGVGYAPYELSNEANVALAPTIDAMIARVEEYIGALTRNEIEKFQWTTKGKFNFVTHKQEMIQHVATKGSKDHEKRRQIELAGEESNLRFHQSNKVINDRMIAEWVLKDLPGEFTK
jgi:hypothetical protein